MTYYPMESDFTGTYLYWEHYSNDITVMLNEFAREYIKTGDMTGITELCGKIRLMIME